jgi:hypothetical protein
MGTISQLLATGFNAAQGQSTDYFTTLRDYQHAHKIFTASNNSFLPKSKNWFHIFFQLNPAVISTLNADLSTAISNNRINWNPGNLNILGVLARTVKLPNFKFVVEKKNQYNRWSLTQTKMTYEPIDISFWDDTVDVIRGFWYAYYQYNIQDPRWVNFDMTQTQGIPVPFEWAGSNGNTSYLYSSPSNWGVNYGLDTVDTVGTQLNRTAPFFDTIRIYQFNHETTTAGPQYSEYVLVNPVISAFDHDMVDFSTSEYMQNKMTIEYETVLYNAGFVEDDEIASWDAVLQTFFDTTPSPLTGVNPAVNNAHQLGSVLASSFALGTEAIELGLNTGQATPATVLTAAIGTASAVEAASNNAAQGTLAEVPSVITGYGTGGAPPTVPGT